jgi:hypothetical protein
VIARETFFLDFFCAICDFSSIISNILQWPRGGAIALNDH